MEKLIRAGLIQQRDLMNTIHVGCVILKSVAEDPDQYLEQLLTKLREAGVADVGNEILRLLARKYSVPAIMAPAADNDIAESNETHFVARTADEWYTHLSRLLRDEALRRQLGESGRRYAEKHYSIEAHVPKLAQALRSAKNTV